MVCGYVANALCGTPPNQALRCKMRSGAIMFVWHCIQWLTTINISYYELSSKSTSDAGTWVRNFQTNRSQLFPKGEHTEYSLDNRHSRLNSSSARSLKSFPFNIPPISWRQSQSSSRRASFSSSPKINASSPIPGPISNYRP
jgi:hypothetical protein